MNFDSSLFVVVAIFAVVYVALKLALFDPLLRILKRREARIEAARQAWEHANVATQEALDAERQRLLAARREAAARRETLRREALQQRTETVAQAESEARARLDAAQVELAGQLDREQQRLGERVATLAAHISERLAGRAV